MGLGVQPSASGREGVGVARGPRHCRAKVLLGRRVRAAATMTGRRCDCSMVVVDVIVAVVVVVLVHVVGIGIVVVVIVVLADVGRKSSTMTGNGELQQWDRKLFGETLSSSAKPLKA